MKALACPVVVDVPVGALAHGVARGALAEQVFQNALHFVQGEPLLQAIKLNREGPEFINEDPLFCKIGRPTIG